MSNASEAVKARRRARRARWQRPLETAQDRREAWASLLLSDHGFLRLAYRNRRQVTPDLWRSAQPSPRDIRWAAQRGIRTVLSLRGEGNGGDLLEQEACTRHNLNFERIVMWSRGAPPKDSLYTALDRFPQLERPILLHCKSGADRAGLGAALFRIIVDGAPVAIARKELSLRYGHIRHAKTGILDAFLDAFETTGEARGIDLRTWVTDHYDPAALKASFVSNRAGDTLLSLLRRE
ncbi:MAG: sulfur transferase domain-containing protein [Pseudomonadota bacterium]